MCTAQLSAGYSRMTSTLYVALISPAQLETLQVYLPLCSGIRFFRLRVHFFWRPSPTSCSVSGRSSFSHTMSGRGFPLAAHLSRTELPTGRAITLFLIFVGWVKRGRTLEESTSWLLWVDSIIYLFSTFLKWGFMFLLISIEFLKNFLISWPTHTFMMVEVCINPQRSGGMTLTPNPVLYEYVVFALF